MDGKVEDDALQDEKPTGPREKVFWWKVLGS